MKKTVGKQIRLLLALIPVLSLLCSCSNAKAEQQLQPAGFESYESNTTAGSAEREETTMTEVQTTKEAPLQTLQYAPSAGYVPNPYMGLCVWAEEDLKRIKQEVSLVYVDVTWAELEPERGSFDFASMEKRCQFDTWKSLGKHAVFRLVLDEPSEEAHMDIPQWLFALTGDGQFYDTDYGKGYSPNYTNETLIAEHRRVVKALGEHFAADGFVKYVQLGSLGHWGEWHIHPDVAQFPSMAVCKRYFLPYTEYFTGATLMLRRPFAFSAGYTVGLYNDSCCLAESTQVWLQWIREGGDYDDTGEEGALMPMTSAWKKSAIGGEITSMYEDVGALLMSDAKRISSEFYQSHQSWVGPYSFACLDTSASDTLKKNFDEVMKHIGYRLYVRQVERYDDRLEVTIANDGVAPFYYDWNTVFLLNGIDGTSREVIPDFDIRSVLPNESKVVTIPLREQVASVWIKVRSKDLTEEISLCNDLPQIDRLYCIYQSEPAQ